MNEPVPLRSILPRRGIPDPRSGFPSSGEETGAVPGTPRSQTRLRTRIGTLTLIAALLGSGLPLRAESTGTVTAGRVNVRSRPSLAGEVVAQLVQGQEVRVLGPADTRGATDVAGQDWLRIALPEGVPVWVSEAFLDPETRRVVPARLNVRAGPGEDYGVLGTIPRGTEVRPIDGGDGWFRIEPPPGLAAYVSAGFVVIAPDVPPPAVPAPASETPPVSSPAAAHSVPSDPSLAAAPPPGTATTVPADATPKTADTVGAPRPADTSSSVVPEGPAPAVTEAMDVAPAQGPQTADAAAATPAPVPPTAAAPAGAAGLDEFSDIPRFVQREGRLVGTASIQAPTPFELRAIDTGRRLNYVWPGGVGMDFRVFRGARVQVTGEEYLDPRWPVTPILRVERIILAP